MTTTATAPETTAPARPASPSIGSWLRNYAIAPIVLLLIIIMSFAAPNFLSVRNFMNLIDQNAPLMLIALGTTFVIISGAFDLSTGQIMSMSGVIAAKVALVLQNPALGLIVGLLVGIPVGLVNGYLVGRLQINSFLTTLATGLTMGGIALLVTQGLSLDLSSSSNFRWLGSHRFGDVPVSVIVIVLTYLILGFLLSRTVFGRHLYSVGSNAEAARLSGIATSRIRIAAYTVGALTAALAGLILVSRTGVGNVYAGASNLTLMAIAAVVIGGTSILGGKGALWRTVLGVLLLALTQNAFNLLSIQPYWQQIVSGLIILAAVILNAGALKR
ncbi:ABC transporter permease [Gordonia sp. HNM0687]|uniref:ABC transporter permease n=1 Tax=Gordonia mangrovi TaxID=2665643 RepID=A0A6L7GTW0_9ACTN|nr:ABC transporter permease [Gordonia mangrovi]MXP23454.1 ABC transporter permease [Gordonia mangrovi]UVF76650.1 ABC transporter permease [Gordonia mangrovi]